MSATFTDHEGGDILEAPAASFVCPVNCVPGVMGRGLALTFAKRWPSLRSDHRLEVQAGRLAPGRVAVSASAPVLFFPTKRHWRHPARLEDVRAGLESLARLLRGSATRSVAIPALGCGLGGLDWADVRPLILAALEPLDIEVHLFAPQGDG